MDIENSPETNLKPLTTAVNESLQVEEDEFMNMQRNYSHHQSVREIKKKEIKDQEVFYSTCGKWCYQISIIDYLQTFDSGKK